MTRPRVVFFVVVTLTVVASLKAAPESDSYTNTLVEDPLQPVWDSLDALADKITSDIKVDLRNRINSLTTSISNKVNDINRAIRGKVTQVSSLVSQSVNQLVCVCV